MAWVAGLGIAQSSREQARLGGTTLSRYLGSMVALESGPLGLRILFMCDTH